MSKSSPKIFKKLIKAGYSDVMIPAFVHQALSYYADAVLEEMSPDDNDASIINPATWISTAKEVKKILADVEKEHS